MTRHFHPTKSRIVPETIRRRLDFPEEDEEEMKFMKQIPLMSKLVMIQKNKESDKDNIDHVVKKMKTTVTDTNINNNNVSFKEDPVIRAKALSKTQLLQLLADLTLEDVDRNKLRSMLPRPDISGQVSSLTYHMHNIHRSIPQSRLSSHTDSYRWHIDV